MGALEKNGWVTDTNTWMTDVQGGDLLARKMIFSNSQFWLSYNLLKNAPN